MMEERKNSRKEIDRIRDLRYKVLEWQDEYRNSIIENKYEKIALSNLVLENYNKLIAAHMSNDEDLISYLWEVHQCLGEVAVEILDHNETLN